MILISFNMKTRLLSLVSFYLKSKLTGEGGGIEKERFRRKRWWKVRFDDCSGERDANGLMAAII